MRQRAYPTRAEFQDHIKRDWRSAHGIRVGVYDYAELDYSRIKGLTAGSVVFAGSTGYLNQDNANLFWDDTNNFLGIHETTPTALQHINSIGGSIPCLNLEGGAEGELVTPDGQALRIGHWNSGTTTFTERMKMDSSGYWYIEERLGINLSAAPNEVLEINGRLRLNGTSYSRIMNYVAAGREILLLRGKSTTADGAGINIYGDADSTFAGNIVFLTNNTTALTIDNAGLITSAYDIKLAEGEGLAVGGTPVADTVLIETSDADDPTLILKTTSTAHQVNIALDESAVADHVDLIGQTASVDTYFHVIGKAGQSAKMGVQIGSYRGELICGPAGHISLKNITEDKDLVFGIDDGGVTKTITWDADIDTLIHSAGTFNIQGLISMDTAVATALAIGNSFTGSQITFTGSSATDHAIEIDGVYSAALIYTHTASATADTLLWGDMASTATAGDFNGLRPRLTCNAASGGLNARATYSEVIVGASKYAALAQGVLAHVSYAAGSCEITDIHALGVHISQGASLTATNLYAIIATVQTRGDETISGDDWMIRLNNEAVGGNGRQMDGAIQIVDTNLSGGIIGYGYGIDMSGATIATADIRLQNGEIIENLIDGTINIIATYVGINESTCLGTFHVDIGDGGSGKGFVLDLSTENAVETWRYAAIDFRSYTSGLIGQFLASGNTYVNAAINLPVNSVGVFAEAAAGSLILYAGGASGDIRLGTGGYGTANERMRIDSSGNVGIGTIPSTLLHLQGTNPRLIIGDTVSATGQRLLFGTHVDYWAFGIGIETANILSIGRTAVDADASDDTVDTANALNISAANLYWKDTTNANMSQGFTINQGAVDDEILAFKSSDIAHGMTGLAETDTYGTFSKVVGASGGVYVVGYGEAEYAIFFVGYYTTDNTTKGSGALAPIMFDAYKKSGTGGGVQGANANVFVIRSGGGVRWQLDEDGDTWQSGILFINEPTNANMTLGITINQAGADDEILAFKSTDVAHGVTAVTETDTYGMIKKLVGASGALKIEGFGESYYGIYLTGTGGLDNTDHDATGLAPIMFDAFLAAGAGRGAVGANANIVAIRMNSSTRWILDEDGDTWQAGSIISDSGNSIFTTSGLFTLQSAAVAQEVQVDTYDATPGASSQFKLRVSNHDTLGTMNTTDDGDNLGYLLFQGVDSGNTFDSGGKITVIQDGAAGVRVPANMFLSTYSDTAENENQLVLHHDGYVLIGDTVNAKMAIGLTINQAANDDEILAFKSSDIAHGVTDIAETDTYAYFGKESATGGGLQIVGLGEGNEGFNLAGVCTTDDTNKDATANAPIRFIAYKKDGTGIGAVGADANIVVFQMNNSSRFIFDEDGDMFYDGAAPANYDRFNDPAACHDLMRILYNMKRGAKEHLTDFIHYNKDDLISMGVISSGGFVSTKGIAALQLGAISQLYKKDKEHEERIIELENKNKLLENKIKQLEA